ncbi:MAG: TetR/AcrR family transcriptional regulator [Pseudomonadota bacterium]
MNDKRRRGQLSREEILAEGMALAREVGLDFPMRTIANRLNAWPNAVYSYFEHKRDLQNALIDEIIAEFLDGDMLTKVTDASVPWDVRLRNVSLELYDHLIQYDRAGYLMVNYGMLGEIHGPKLFRSLLIVVLSSGLAPRRALELYHAAVTFLIQMVELGSAGLKGRSSNKGVSYEIYSSGAPDDLAEVIEDVIRQPPRARLITGIDAFLVAARHELDA